LAQSLDTDAVDWPQLPPGAKSGRLTLRLSGVAQIRNLVLLVASQAIETQFVACPRETGLRHVGFDFCNSARTLQIT
jgi:hypothetical protein